MQLVTKEQTQSPLFPFLCISPSVFQISPPLFISFIHYICNGICQSNKRI